MTAKRGAPPEEIAAVIADVLEEDEGWIAKRSSRGWETLALEVFVPYALTEGCSPASMGFGAVVLEVYVPEYVGEGPGSISWRQVGSSYVATIAVFPSASRIIISGNRLYEKRIKAALVKRGFQGVTHR